MYNATVYQIDPRTGQITGIHAAEVNAEGLVLCSTLLQATGLEGSPNYELHLQQCGYFFTVTHDGGQGYQQHLQEQGRQAGSQFPMPDR